MIKDKILAVMIEEPSWMYYVKYRQYLLESGNPFIHKIDYVTDSRLLLRADIIKNYPVVVFYHRDPLKYLYANVYRYAKKIEKICLQNNIRLINRPDPLSASVKSIQLRILADSGFRVARSCPFRKLDDLAKAKISFYPIFIRNNAGHDSHNITMEGPFGDFMEAKTKYAGLSLARKKHLSGKVAVEWIDTRDKDGLYRRYRAFACGKQVVTGNLHISAHWYIHAENKLLNNNAIAESHAFMAKEYSKTEKDFFLRVNKVLNLEFSAIDYSIDADGNMVIWEANPHPAIGDWADLEPSKSKITNLLTTFYFEALENKLNSVLSASTFV